MKNWTNFWNNTVSESFTIPGIKVEDIMIDLDKPNNNYKKVIASHFNTREDYIDLENIRIFKVNDLTGDILKNNRVILKVFVLHDDDLEKVKNNITDLFLSEFYSSLPNTVNIFGIDVKPTSFIDEKDLLFTINGMLTNDKLVEIIKNVTLTQYKGYVDGYMLFYKKD